MVLGCGWFDQPSGGHTGGGCDSAPPVDFTAEQFAESVTGQFQASLSWGDGEPDTVLTVDVTPSLDTVQNTQCGARWALFPSYVVLKTEDERMDGPFTSGVLQGDTLGQAQFSGNSETSGVWAPLTVHVDVQVFADGTTTGEIFTFQGESNQTATW